MDPDEATNIEIARLLQQDADEQARMMGTHSPWGANDSDNDDEDYAAGSKKKGKRKAGAGASKSVARKRVALDDDGGDAAEDEDDAYEPAADTTAPKRSSVKSADGGPVTLLGLIRSGVMAPGTKCLTLDYKGMTYHADLLPNGNIKFEGKEFESPSNFSLFVKRKTNPDRKADSGWTCVKYRGKVLNDFKSGGGGGRGKGSKPRAKKAGSESPPGPPPPPRPKRQAAAAVNYLRDEDELIDEDEEMAEAGLSPASRPARPRKPKPQTDEAGEEGADFDEAAAPKPRQPGAGRGRGRGAGGGGGGGGGGGRGSAAKPKRAPQRRDSGSDDGWDLAAPSTARAEMTEYARSRPQRERKPVSRLGVVAGAASDLQMVVCQRYLESSPALALTPPAPVASSTPNGDAASNGDSNGAPGGAPAAVAAEPAAAAPPAVVASGPAAAAGRRGLVEPFSLVVEPSAVVVMDMHAHLHKNEIIGFLGGTWDPERKRLCVTRALPARQLNADGTDGAVEVELDPESLPPICEALEAESLRVVGWYHSHPVFLAQPSLRDIENQINYQRMFRDAGGVPFLGSIVGPYDSANPTVASDIRWFHVLEDSDAIGGGVPYEFTPQMDGAAPLAEAVEPLTRSLAEGCGKAPDRISLATTWKGMVKWEKLAASLSTRLPASLPDGASREEYAKMLMTNLFGEAPPKPAPKPARPAKGAAAADGAEGAEAEAEAEGVEAEANGGDAEAEAEAAPSTAAPAAAAGEGAAEAAGAPPAPGPDGAATAPVPMDAAGAPAAQGQAPPAAEAGDRGTASAGGDGAAAGGGAQPAAAAPAPDAGGREQPQEGGVGSAGEASAGAAAAGTDRGDDLAPPPTTTVGGPLGQEAPAPDEAAAAGAGGTGTAAAGEEQKGSGGGGVEGPTIVARPPPQEAAAS